MISYSADQGGSMDSIFENQHTHTKSMYRRLYAHSIFLRPAALIMQVLLIGFLVWYTLYLDSLWLLPVFLLLFYGLLLLPYVRIVRLLWKRVQENSRNAPVIVTATFYEDRIEYANSFGATLTFSYTDIVKVLRTGEYWFLSTRAKQVLTVKRDCFTKGEEADFPAFLGKRGFRA